jgi:hypothetical protein
LAADAVTNDAEVGDGVNKRSAILVAAGLVVSLAAGFVAFMNGALGPAAEAVTRPSPAAVQKQRVEGSAHREPISAGTALADRRTSGPTRDGRSRNDD